MALSTDWMRFVPSFNGSRPKPQEATSFIRKLEQTASQNKWDEANTIIGFEMRLEDSADGWWTFYKEDHPNSCQKWDVVKKEFLKQYSNDTTGIKVQRSVEEVKQRTDEDVYAFSIRVQRIVRDALPRSDYALGNDHESMEAVLDGLQKARERHMLDRFMLGLRPEIKNILKSRNYGNTLESALKEAIRIQESHQILPTKKRDEGKIHEISENVGTTKEETNDEPQEPWEKAISKLSEQIAAINSQIKGDSNNKPSRNQRRTQNRGNGRGRGRGNGRGGNNNYNQTQSNQGWNNGYSNNNGQQWNNGNSNGQQKAIMCYRCRRWGNHTARNCNVSGRDLALMEEQMAPPAMVNSISAYDNMRGPALNF